ncbi:MAG: hypothetical protein Q7J67_00535 [bacterium]|nr:hypothetical protein [bacterium]
MDIVERLKGILKKDQLLARDWDEYGDDIECEIEDAIEEIERLRISHLNIDKHTPHA